jgi:hypothetical protein
MALHCARISKGNNDGIRGTALVHARFGGVALRPYTWHIRYQPKRGGIPSSLLRTRWRESRRGANEKFRRPLFVHRRRRRRDRRRVVVSRAYGAPRRVGSYAASSHRPAPLRVRDDGESSASHAPGLRVGGMQSGLFSFLEKPRTRHFALDPEDSFVSRRQLLPTNANPPNNRMPPPGIDPRTPRYASTPSLRRCRPPNAASYPPRWRPCARNSRRAFTSSPPSAWGSWTRRGIRTHPPRWMTSAVRRG